MRRLLLSLLLLVVGCTTYGPEDQAYCAGLGYTPGTDGFRACLERSDTRRCVKARMQETCGEECLKLREAVGAVLPTVPLAMGWKRC